MKIKTFFSVIFLFCLILGLVWLIAIFREKKHNGLVIIGKAPNFSFINQKEKILQTKLMKGKFMSLISFSHLALLFAL